MLYIYSDRTLIYPKLIASTFTTFSFHCVYIHCHPCFFKNPCRKRAIETVTRLEERKMVMMIFKLVMMIKTIMMLKVELMMMMMMMISWERLS